MNLPSLGHVVFYCLKTTHLVRSHDLQIITILNWSEINQKFQQKNMLFTWFLNNTVHNQLWCPIWPFCNYILGGLIVQLCNFTVSKANMIIDWVCDQFLFANDLTRLDIIIHCNMTVSLAIVTIMMILSFYTIALT